MMQQRTEQEAADYEERVRRQREIADEKAMD